MSTTPNCRITYIDPTLSPIPQINDALRVIDALLQCAVLGFEDDPPVGPADGDQYIVGTGTGAWVGEDKNLAQWVDEGAFWQFYEAGTQVRLVLNLANATLYAYNGSAWAAPGTSSVAWGAITGTLSAQTDLQAALDAKAAAGIPQNSQSANYTLVLSDANKHILHPSADTTARVFTIPANSSVAYPIGTAETFVNQDSAGVITIAITTDTMRLAGAGTTGSRTLAANGIATALKITSTEWIISGTGLT